MGKNILAIDPGTEQSAYVIWNGNSIIEADILPNDKILDLLKHPLLDYVLVIEWIESYGMAVGKEVFLTCRWCGRFEQASGQSVYWMPRKEVKLHHCHTVRATDANIRTALIDRFGAPGTKTTPGLTYGLKKDMWSAFAIATTHYDRLHENESKAK